MSRSESQIIPADTYPMLLSQARSRQAMAMLRSPETAAKARRVIAMKTAELRGAVLNLVQDLEEAVRVRDWPTVFAHAHEIRGLAGTAGLVAAGQIANVFCRYLDIIAPLGAEPDLSVVSLHLDAIVRSTRTEDDTARHGETVAQQLAALVERKLADIKDSARP